MEEFLQQITKINTDLKTKSEALTAAKEKDRQKLEAASEKAQQAVSDLTAEINALVSQGRIAETAPLRLKLTELRLNAALAIKAICERQVQYDTDYAELNRQASGAIGQIIGPAREKAEEMRRQLNQQLAELTRSYDAATRISDNFDQRGSLNSKELEAAQAQVDSIIKSALV